MSLKIYFVRHGQSTANLKDYFYNDYESPLTELGREQARQTGINLVKQNVKFDVILCSPYVRAMETCGVALVEARPLLAPINLDDDIAERNFDGLVGVKLPREQADAIWDYNSPNSSRNGIESLNKLEARARKFLHKVKKAYNNKNILVFSHGGFGLMLRAVVDNATGGDLLAKYSFLENGEIMILEY